MFRPFWGPTVLCSIGSSSVAAAGGSRDSMRSVHTTITALVLVLLSGCGPDATIEEDESSQGPAIADKAADRESREAPVAAEEASGAASTGTVRGRIVFDGPRPAPRLLVAEGKATRDETVCAAHGNIMDESLIVSESGGLANVFVYLDRAPRDAAIPPPPDEPLILDQKGCVYTPHALIVRAGQTTRILSDDAVAHNTHTFPKRNTPFNQTIPPRDRDGVELVYRRSELEPVEVKCDLHTWMRAWHLPLDHPFAAITDADGTFRINDLPAGQHKFRIWHEHVRGGFLDRAYVIAIRPGQNDLGTISFPASRFDLEEQP